MDLTSPQSSPAPPDHSGSGLALVWNFLHKKYNFQVCFWCDNRVWWLQSSVWLHSKSPGRPPPHCKMWVWAWRAHGLSRWVPLLHGVCSHDYHAGNANVSEEHIAYATKYGEPIDCTWIITADPGSQIFIQFAEFELSMPNDCNFNYIQVGDLTFPFWILNNVQCIAAVWRGNRYWGSNHYLLWINRGIKDNNNQHFVCKVSQKPKCTWEQLLNPK